MQVAGREFSESILDRIRRRVADVPTLTRSALSREVCHWLGWRGADGRLNDMRCRTALLKLEIRHAEVKLRSPKRLKGPELQVWAVRVAQERNAPARVEPLEWMLLTALGH